MSTLSGRPKKENPIIQLFLACKRYYLRFSKWHSDLRTIEATSIDIVIGGIILFIVPFIGLSVYYWSFRKAWDYICKHIDPIVWIFIITYIISVLIYFQWKFLYFNIKRNIILIVFAILISIIFWVSTVNLSFKLMNIQVPPIITYTLTPTSTPTSSSTKTPTFSQTFTPTKTVTSTLTNTPTSIYDPIIISMLTYYDHIPNNRTNTIDYDIAWSILTDNYKDNFKSCNSCNDAKERWIWYIKQYYWNITPSDLRNSGAIITKGSYAKATYHLEKIQIDGNNKVYDDVISICLFKETTGWKISYMPNGTLSSIDDCIIYK